MPWLTFGFWVAVVKFIFLTHHLRTYRFLLPLGHTFCSRSIDALFVAHHRIKCPLCRTRCTRDDISPIFLQLSDPSAERQPRTPPPGTPQVKYSSEVLVKLIRVRDGIEVIREGYGNGNHAGRLDQAARRSHGISRTNMSCDGEPYC